MILPNTAAQPRLEAGAPRTLEAVSSTSWFGAVAAEPIGSDSACVCYATRTASTTLNRPAVGMMRSTR
jgi:hypothetical protein